MMVNPSQPFDVRASRRRAVDFEAHLREVGGIRLDVVVKDLSTTGFRVESLYTIGVGKRIFLTIPSFAPLAATVAWSNPTGYGCQFEHPLHIAVFDAIAARYGSI